MHFSLLHPTISLFPSISKFTQTLYIHQPLKLRCSIVNEFTISPSKPSPNLNADSSATMDVIVRGGINGLCIAQARDCVGGNITTLVSDKYLCEERRG